MNLHPGKMDMPMRSGCMERKSAKSFSYAPFIFKSMLLFLAFMGVLVGHLYLRQQSVKAAERADSLKKQIEDVRSETRNLRNQVAKLNGWPNIRMKIEKFKLGLGPAAPGQIMRIGVYTPRQAASVPLTPLSVASASRGTR